MTSDENKKTKTKLLEVAKKRFKQAEEAETEIRKEALDDLHFRSGEQWPDEIKVQRNHDRRPTLTINRLPQFVRQVTNDQRQNRPSIRVSPVDDNADKDTAKVLQGLIRHIESDSNAEIAYDTAFESAATCGFGYFRIVTDYVHEEAFEQEIKIKRIRNPFSVYMDPTYQEPDASDANWAFIFEDMTYEDFKLAYPKSELSSMNDLRSIGDQEPDWLSGKSVRVAEYFYKDFEEKVIVQVQMEDAVVVMDLDKLPEDVTEDMILDKRKTRVPVIKWCKLNGVEILEKQDWAGKWIPIVPVLGDELEIDGNKKLEGIIRHAKDSQRMYNYWASSETEAIALAPRTPFIGAEGQFEGHAAKWKTANTRNHAYLEYKPTTLANGTPAPPPQRMNFEPAVAAITNARMQSSEDLKATTGIYDAALGHRSNETSGVAITARSHQAQTANFHFIDNLSRALKHAGRILVDLIPKVYDTERTVRIIGEEDNEEIVKINQVFEKNGEEKKTFLGYGKYDVTVATGPSFATKRQEAVETMISLTQQYPQIAQIAGDLIVKNMDWAGTEEIAERLKKTIPPEYLEGEGDEKKIPPQVQAQIKQLTQMLEQQAQEIAVKTEILDKEKFKYDLEKYKVDKEAELKRSKIEADMRIALLKEEGADSRFAFEKEIQELDRKNKMQGMNQVPAIRPPINQQMPNPESGNEGV